MTVSALSPKVIHDTANEEYRSPIGAVKTNDIISLSLKDTSGSIVSAQLFLWCDEWERVYETQSNGDRFSISIKASEKPEALWYAFLLTLRNGEVYWLCADNSGRFGKLMSSRGEGFRLTVYDSDFDTPDWFKKSIMYQIFPDRFSRDGSGAAQKGIAYHRSLGRQVRYHEEWSEPVDWQPNGNEGFYFPLDFYGGTLRGIEERLSYLKKLGVSLIYLNPVFEARSNHRYDTADYFKIDPILGTNEDFESLCKTASGHGIHIMLDGVFSHTGADSVYFNKFGRYPSIGAYNGGRDSKFYPWFDFRSFPDDYRCWWNFKDLPEINETDHDWQNLIISGEDSVIKTWLRRGAAGFRLDVADELPDHILSMIRSAVKSVSPDNVVLGEVWEDAVIKTSYGRHRQYALGCALDSVMNYPLRSALISFFTWQSNARELADFLLAQRLNYPAPMYQSLMNLLSSHDVERIRTALATRLDIRTLTREQQAAFRITDIQDAHGCSMQKLCSAVQFSIPGVPCVYYGEETGMHGMLDPFDRAPFSEGNRPLTQWYSNLGRIRSENEALSIGAASFSAPNEDVLCILRFLSEARDSSSSLPISGAFLILVNRAAQEQLIVADLWLDNAGLTAAQLTEIKSGDTSRGTCLLSGAEVTLSFGLAKLLIPPETVYIFRLT